MVASVILAAVAIAALALAGAVLLRARHEQRNDGTASPAAAAATTPDQVETMQAIVEAAVDQMLDRQIGLLADDRTQRDTELRHTVEELIGRSKTVLEGERTV